MKTKLIALFCLCLLSFIAVQPAAQAAEKGVQFADFEGKWLADLENSVNLGIPQEELEIYKTFTIIIDTKQSLMTMMAGEHEETSTIENTKPGSNNTLQFNMDGHSLVMKKVGPNSIAIIDGDEVFMFNRVK